MWKVGEIVEYYDYLVATHLRLLILFQKSQYVGVNVRLFKQGIGKSHLPGLMASGANLTPGE